MPEQDEKPEQPEAEQASTEPFSVPTPGRARLHGRFDEIPPLPSAWRNLANRRRVIE
jgi:hypothetical protein